MNWTASGRLHPSGSLVARALRRWIGDPLRSEALHLLCGSAFVLACVGAYLLSGSLPPDASGLLATWAIWIGVAGCLAGLIGWKPGIDVLIDREALLICQGDTDARIELSEIVECGALNARTFHRVYRRYAGVRTFAVLTDALLLIETASGPIVLGLDSARDRDALHDALSTHPAVSCAATDPVAVLA